MDLSILERVPCPRRPGNRAQPSPIPAAVRGQTGRLPEIVPNPQSTLIGTLVGFESSSYKGFTANDGRQIQPGVKYTVWLSCDEHQAPQPIRCNPEQYIALDKLGFGEMVAAEVTYFAEGRGFKIVLDTFEVFRPSAADEAPSNGKVKASA